jgi:hypothetical protein
MMLYAKLLEALKEGDEVDIETQDYLYENCELLDLDDEFVKFNFADGALEAVIRLDSIDGVVSVSAEFILNVARFVQKFTEPEPEAEEV